AHGRGSCGRGSWTGRPTASIFLLRSRPCARRQRAARVSARGDDASLRTRSYESRLDRPARRATIAAEVVEKNVWNKTGTCGRDVCLCRRPATSVCPFADTNGAFLLELDGGTRLHELLLDVLGVGLGDLLLDRLR